MPSSSAAVIGGSLAGLLAARALSKRFDRVLVYERDELADEPRARKGVPQARHVHVLLAAGAEALSDLLPGLFEDVASYGGFTLDMSRDNNWFHFGSWKRRVTCGLEVHFQSRDLLEYVIRKHVLSAPNVELCLAAVDKVDWESGKPRLEAAGAREEFDFLVDASGRASRLPEWLEQSGFERPREDSVRVDVTYTSARFRPRREQDFRALLVYPNPPRERRAGGVFPIEGREVLSGVFGWCGERAEPNDDSVMQYARSLPRPEVAEFLEHAERISEYSSYQYREARLRHYEELAAFPPRTVVLGDALCSVDPVFGQGMTVAALSARILERCANDSTLDSVALAEKFRRSV
jgi:2-polyprenyl-6-methoxyphenol hydroxylase-like FAD-dependent oxidoreductase